MKCKYKKSNGSACKGFAVKNSDFCWAHTPKIDDKEKQYSRYRGGVNRHAPVLTNLPEIIVKDSRDIPLLLSDTIYHLRHGKMDVRLGTAIGYVSNILLRSFEVADLEVRIEKIEDYMHKHFNPEELNDC